MEPTFSRSPARPPVRICAIALLLLPFAIGAACTKKPTTDAGSATGGAAAVSADASANIPAGADQATDLKITDVKVGSGAEAVTGKTVKVNYTGWTTDGKQFDSSIGRAPFDFQLGAGMVIQGWDKGVAGMKIGGKRKLVIPPALGYGDNGVPGAIPPNSVLVFDVELLEVL